MQFALEYTDTFGGEANYSWVIRKEFSVPDPCTDRMVVLRAKQELGLTGARCARDSWGDTIVLRPVGMCQVIFIDAI